MQAPRTGVSVEIGRRGKSTCWGPGAVEQVRGGGGGQGLMGLVGCGQEIGLYLSVMASLLRVLSTI